ncbi:hypothetical protein AOLI_G00176640 [Acnodon oligacanthus]
MVHDVVPTTSGGTDEETDLFHPWSGRPRFAWSMFSLALCVGLSIGKVTNSREVGTTFCTQIQTNSDYTVVPVPRRLLAQMVLLLIRTREEIHGAASGIAFGKLQVLSNPY